MNRKSTSPENALIGRVSLLHRSVLLRPAGDAGDEVLRICGENLELRPLQWAQRRREGFNAPNGEPPLQTRNGGVVLATGIARGRDLKAGIAEVAMDGFAERLAGVEIGNNDVIKLEGA